MKTPKKGGSNKYTTQTKSPFIQGAHKASSGNAKIATEIKKVPKRTGQK